MEAYINLEPARSSAHGLLPTRVRRKRVLRAFFDYLAASPHVDDPHVGDRLFQTVLDRRAAILLSLVSTFWLALATIYLTAATWPFAWLAADGFLIASRWKITFRAEQAEARQKEHYRDLLIVLACVWGLVLGLATCACMASGNVSLMVLAAIVATSTAMAITSRNAAMPRHAMLLILLISIPFAAGMALSPVPDMIFPAALVLPWLGALYVLLTQNHAVTLRLIEAERTSRSLAERDSLTGLFNRMHFAERLTRAASREGKGEDYSLLCLDLDGFKAINDNHGHAAGDELLRAVSERILAHVRAGDVAFRMGGDEFLVLLPQGDVDACVRVAARLIAAIGVPYELSSGQVVTVGVSIGSACADQPRPNPEALLLQADAALYQAKANGKGIHVHAEPPR